MTQRNGEQFGFWSAKTGRAALPATGSSVIFSADGKVRVLSITGKVTTAVQDQACTLLVRANDGTNTQNLCAATSIRNNGAGVLYTLDGEDLTASVKTTIAAGLDQKSPFIVDAGDIEIVTSATNTGNVKWEIEYQPLDAGARVTSKL